MAATGPKVRAALLSALLFLACRVPGCAADVAPALKREVNYVAAALTAGDAGDAMTPFSKSFAPRERLANYFAALTAAFNVSNEVDFLEEQDHGSEIVLTVRWGLTVSDRENNTTQHRAEELTLRLIQENGKWRIAGLDPVSFFDPSGNDGKS